GDPFEPSLDPGAFGLVEAGSQHVQWGGGIALGDGVCDGNHGPGLSHNGPPLAAVGRAPVPTLLPCPAVSLILCDHPRTTATGRPMMSLPTLPDCAPRHPSGCLSHLPALARAAFAAG
ncbi:hypothetical protein RZS08_09130, partial [Arthrospira platensis SPKY1]|nr:hypothetical protein [Arthrospira platensis SPKY1]